MNECIFSGSNWSRMTNARVKSLLAAKRWATSVASFEAGTFTLSYNGEVWEREMVKYNNGTFKWLKWTRVY